MSTVSSSVHPTHARGVRPFQHAEVHRAARGEHRAHAQQQTGQMQAAGDHARFDKAIGFTEIGEQNRTQQSSHGRDTHEQTEKGSTDTLCICITCSDAVESQHSGVEEGKAQTCKEHRLPVISSPALTASVKEPAQALQTWWQGGTPSQM